MHIPDGLIDLPTSVGAAALAVPVVVASSRRAGHALTQRDVPLAAVVAAYLLVAELLVFPIGLGTSAHLIGAGFALVLVGPWIATTCITVVLVLQALLFADGGVSALGLNAWNSGLVPIFVGWVVLASLMRLLGGSRRWLPLVAGLAAGIGVLAGAGAFCVEYVVGGPSALDRGNVIAAMLGAHAVSGAIEGVLTALLVAALLRTRPDLLRGGRWLAPAPVVIEADR